MKSIHYHQKLINAFIVLICVLFCGCRINEVKSRLKPAKPPEIKLISDEGQVKEIDLKNSQWTIKIIPQTLEIRCHPHQKEEFTISAALKQIRKTAAFKQNKNGVEWEFDGEGLKFNIDLIANEIRINIQAQNNGRFTFPVINKSNNLAGLILPHWQGIYAPLNDQAWQKLLLKREFNTLEGLTMPFFGLDLGDYYLTYIITNRYNNEITFNQDNDAVFQTRFTHAFTRNRDQKEYGFIIKLSPAASPVQPAKEFRQYLISRGQFVTMKEKARKIPKANRLAGAVHAYLWGDLRMTLDDVYEKQWRALCREIVKQAESKQLSPGKRIKELMLPKDWQELKTLSTLEYLPYMYIKLVVAEGFSKVLSKPDFYRPEYFSGIKIPAEFTRPDAGKTNLSQAQLFRKNSLIFQAAFPEQIRQPDQWGYGYSTRMLNELKKAGIDRARLVHDLWGFGMIDYRPRLADEADKMGYLLGPYDSYNSIHNPDYYGTDASWSTAQFDQELFEKGIIQLWNGKLKAGFAKKGGRLSPIAARPWVEERVRRIMQATSYNSYFIDCDAFGEVFDDYSPLHPATQEQDVNERVDRMKWISETFNLVIGSEGGSSYAAPVIHVAEGMMSTPFGAWQDPDFGNKKSPYYLGAAFPLHGPEQFFKQVPLKDQFVLFHYDPRYRLPLNEIVFHDSFVSTNHYGSGNLKFHNIQAIVELTSLLYLVPPMYHFNLQEFKEKKDYIMQHYRYFSPLHKKMGFSQMTDFSWLTDNRQVQKTVFGDDLEMIANFGSTDFDYQGSRIPAKSILARWIKSNESQIYSSPFVK